MSITMTELVVPAATVVAEDFDLDITLLEVADPARLVQMTDDGCGESCSKSTCISAA